MTIRSMVVMHVPADTGFAIAPLESLFASLLIKFAGGDPQAVHFAYPSIGTKAPWSLPSGVRYFEYVRTSNRRDADDLLVEYAREHRIDFVLFFDRQPVAPLYRRLRRVGVRCLMAYWGAEISSRNAWWKLSLKRIEVFLSRSRLDGLVFESQAMADLARFGRGVPESMIDVVPLGVDISRFSAIRTSYVHDVFSIPAERQIIVYAGHMEERKGVATLLRAARELRSKRGRSDFSVLIFGNRVGEAEAFFPIVRDGELGDHVTFAGYRDDLHLCFPGCNIGVIPSVGWDSFPRTAVELAACGLPLIVSRLGGLPECVDEAVSGTIFPPGDHIALADHLEKLLDEPRAAAQMGRAGRARCEREYTLDVQADRLDRAIRSRLLAERLVIPNQSMRLANEQEDDAAQGPLGRLFRT